MGKMPGLMIVAVGLVLVSMNAFVEAASRRAARVW